MTAQELEIILKEQVKIFDLKKKAFDMLDKLLLEHSEDKDFTGGFTKDEITARFDGYEYRIEKPHEGSTISTSIGLYVENPIWRDGLERIGYYALDANLKGEILDDWYVIEKEKYVKDIGIISHFHYLNKKLPIAYLKRNHIQYEFVSYIAMVGTLFASKQFESAGQFIIRANLNLETVGHIQFDKTYLKNAVRFLKLISAYLVENNLVTDHLKQELTENKPRATSA